jgi:hypothetical protein
MLSVHMSLVWISGAPHGGGNRKSTARQTFMFKIADLGLVSNRLTLG